MQGAAAGTCRGKSTYSVSRLTKPQASHPGGWCACAPCWSRACRAVRINEVPSHGKAQTCTDSFKIASSAFRILPNALPIAQRAPRAQRAQRCTLTSSGAKAAKAGPRTISRPKLQGQGGHVVGPCVVDHLRPCSVDKPCEIATLLCTHASLSEAKVAARRVGVMRFIAGAPETQSWTC